MKAAPFHRFCTISYSGATALEANPLPKEKKNSVQISKILRQIEGQQNETVSFREQISMAFLYI